MLIVIAIALGSGLVGAWVYAGCPLPRTASGRKRVVRDVVSSAPAPGASPARP